VAPAIIELNSVAELEREVFGPVLHVVRFRRAELDKLIDDINATGYGLTFGLHTRLDETLEQVTSRVRVGNIYVNRNVIGAVVGVQPFGGRGLSGTGPKAGGPLYLGRLVSSAADSTLRGSVHSDGAVADFANWLEGRGRGEDAEAARAIAHPSNLGLTLELQGPVGERNLYTLQPRGKVLLAAESESGFARQFAAVLATGNVAVVDKSFGGAGNLSGLPVSVAQRIEGLSAAGALAGALIEGDADRILAINSRIATLAGPLALVQAASREDLRANPVPYNLNWLLQEVSTSINTTAAGGNASLMTID
jgi:RHH-type proline utilization regulon transcriptional repressor/proline dehydrogenase/delta 1-pyrroline-5-carboxylate dehydrogenase